jgi:hypothetical protein
MEVVMETYIGTKIIEAEVLDECTFLAIKKGEDVTNRETRAGYLVRYPDGYESWSPKDVFEEAYRKTSGMPFGLAIEAMKKGFKVARKCWSTKDMYLVYVRGSGTDAGPNTTRGDYQVNPNLIDSVSERLPWIGMKMADDKFVPWVAIQTDMLSDDWEIVG